MQVESIIHQLEIKRITHNSDLKNKRAYADSFTKFDVLKRFFVILFFLVSMHVQYECMCIEIVFLM